MTYEACLAGIHSRKTFSTGGPTLDRISRLMSRLGDPQNNMKVVHVAGTNGKGSTSAMIYAALTEAGFRTGLFTSPYLVDFRERIRICGEMIPKDELVSCYETVMEQESKLEAEGFEPVNEFELVTAIGFVAFARAQLDYVVLEVGLGGRTDPTNLVKAPSCCCITPISLDHTAILGNTVEEIAAEKAGIIKNGCPVVIARQTAEAETVFQRVALQVGAPLIAAPEVQIVSQQKNGSTFVCDEEHLVIPLLGSYQTENAATAYAVLKELGVERDIIQKAFSKVSWPGRLQLFPGNPDVLVDAGHNIAGITTVTGALDTLFAGMRITAIMGMMRDKDYEICIPLIAKRCKTLIGTAVPLPRALEPEGVAECAAPFCNTEFAPDFETALQKARKTDCDLILVCGSVYVAGAAVECLTE